MRISNRLRAIREQVIVTGRLRSFNGDVIRERVEIVPTGAYKRWHPTRK